MFNSTILDVIIGIVALFLGVSLATSAVTEAIASALRLRANTLMAGVGRLLNDPDMAGLAGTLYRHALVNPLAPGTGPNRPVLNHRPSYIEPRHFALALIDVIEKQANAPSLSKAIADIKDEQLKATLTTLYRTAEYRVDRFRDEVATWFDRAMDRLSGDYKRRVRWITLAVALSVAAALNADPVHVGQVLWQRPMLAGPLTTLAQAPAANTGPAAEAAAAIKQLDSAGPLIGWTGFAKDPRGHGHVGIVLMGLGWAIAAGAALFGAPFWFDVLSRFVSLRGTGPPSGPAAAS